MDYHHEVASAALTWSTLKHYAVTRRYLEKFLKEKRNTTDIRINDIDYRFIINFETYLRNHKAKTLLISKSVTNVSQPNFEVIKA
jgi:hypothetical protein